MFAGLYQFGYSFYVYNRLQTAVADAAELGSKIDYDTSNPDTFQQKLQNMVVYGDETSGTSPIVPGLSTSNVNVNVTLDAQSIPRYVTVSIQNYAINSIFNRLTLNNKPQASTKYYGNILCSTC